MPLKRSSPPRLLLSSLLLAALSLPLHADQELGGGFSLADDEAMVDMQKVDNSSIPDAIGGSVTFEGEDEIIIMIVPLGRHSGVDLTKDTFTSAKLRHMALATTGIKDTSHIKEVTLGKMADEHLATQDIDKTYCYLTWSKFFDYRTGKAFSDDVYAGTMMTLLTDSAMLQATSSRYPCEGDALPATPVELMKRLVLAIRFVPPDE